MTAGFVGGGMVHFVSARRRLNAPHTKEARSLDTQSDWTSTARRMWLWPVAILVSFPIGGNVADLVVDGVDSVGAALAGGLIAGAVPIGGTGSRG
jgi:hypothetical protein